MALAGSDPGFIFIKGKALFVVVSNYQIQLFEVKITALRLHFQD